MTSACAATLRNPVIKAHLCLLRRQKSSLKLQESKEFISVMSLASNNYDKKENNQGKFSFFVAVFATELLFLVLLIKRSPNQAFVRLLLLPGKRRSESLTNPNPACFLQLVRGLEALYTTRLIHPSIRAFLCLNTF